MLFFISDGRLGNQIFQYAFLKTLANQNESIITCNMNQFLSTFEHKNKKFIHIKINKLGYSILIRIVKPYIIKPLTKLKIIGYVSQKRKLGRPLTTYEKVSGLINFTFIETDFFQSEEFFNQNIKFKIKEKYINNAYNFLKEIPDDFTRVFIHVRRGDYLNEEFLGEKGIELPKKYYLSSINEIKKVIKNPFFIFLSDDYQYVKCEFSEVQNKIISLNDMATDMAIMSLCTSGITSNSTFSWWGAYLMTNRKTVIYPKYWYGWKQKTLSHQGIFPTWAKVIEPERD